MRSSFRYRSVVAILAGLLFWSASLTESAKTAQGAPPVTCIPQVDAGLIRLEQKQVRLEKLSQVRAIESERLQQELELRLQSKRRQEALERHATEQAIADLVPDQYIDLVLETAERYEVEARLLAAVATVESRWDPQALGTHSDSGLMQILPSTAEWIAGKMELQSYDLFDPTMSLNMGAWYLQTLYHEYGDWSMALAAYNGGPRGAPRGADHPYTQRVMRVYKQQGT